MGRKSRRTTTNDVDVDNETSRRHAFVDGRGVEANSVDHPGVARPVSPTSEEASKRAVKSVDFDAILKHIGEMGRYQLVLYLMMCIPATLPAAFLAFNQETKHSDNLQHVAQSQLYQLVTELNYNGKRIQ